MELQSYYESLLAEIRVSYSKLYILQNRLIQFVTVDFNCWLLIHDYEK